MHHAYNRVASLAQHPSDLSDFVTVIHYRSFLGPRDFVAYGALLARARKKAIILGGRQTATLLDPRPPRFPRIA